MTSFPFDLFAASMLRCRTSDSEAGCRGSFGATRAPCVLRATGFSFPRGLADFRRHPPVGAVLPEVARVGDRPLARVDEEPVRRRRAVVHVQGDDLDAVRVQRAPTAEGAVVMVLQLEPPRLLPGFQHDLRPLAHVDGDGGVQEPEGVRVVEVDVGDERRG